MNCPVYVIRDVLPLAPCMVEYLSNMYLAAVALYFLAHFLIDKNPRGINRRDGGVSEMEKGCCGRSLK